MKYNRYCLTIIQYILTCWIVFVTALVYEILYQKVFGELDRKCNTGKGPKQNPGNDVNNVMTNYYQNGLTEDDAFKEDNEDNSGWTEVVRGRSNKGMSYIVESIMHNHYFCFMMLLVLRILWNKGYNMPWLFLTHIFSYLCGSVNFSRNRNINIYIGE